MQSGIQWQKPAQELDRLAHSAYVEIRDRIVSLDIAPGALLSEHTLGNALGLSRTPIREAMRRLEREYLVTVLPRRGITVTEISLQGQLQLVEFRRGTEARLIARAAMRANPAQRAAMRDLAAQMARQAETGDLAGYIGSDTAFDRQIDEAADNPFMADAMRPIHALVRRYWHTQRGQDSLLSALRLHAAVAAAAGEGEPEPLHQALDRLYDYNEDHILSQMGIRPRSQAGIS